MQSQQPETSPNERSPRAALWAIATLAGAMLADLAETLVDPANTDKASKFYAAAAHHHGRMLASAVLLVVSALLIVAGVSGITRSLRARGRRLSISAYVLSLLGGAGHVALAAFYLVFSTLPTSGLAVAQNIGVVDHIVKSHEAELLAPLAIAFPLAILATFLACVRGRLMTRWALVPIVLAPVAAVGLQGSDELATSLALGLFLVAAALLATGPRRSPRPRIASRAQVAIV